MSVNSNLTLQANFKKKTYPLTVNISGNGSVKEEIVSTSKSTDYEVGTTIRLTPIPIADETIFLKWAGDLTGDDSPVEITVDQPKTVTATFEFAVYNGVVGKWKVKKEKAGTSKNFDIDYIIFNSDFTYEVGLIDDADSNDTSTALVTGTFDIISNEKIELYQVTVQLEPISAGAVDNIKLEINNTISFELDFAPKTGDFIGTIKQTVDNATKDLNYDPVTKSTITQTTTSVTSTSTTSSNTTQSFTSTPTLTFPKFQSNVFNFCNNQPIPSDAVSWFIFYDPSSITSLTSQNAITNIEVSNLPNGINFTIDNQPDDLNGSAQIAIKIGGTPIDNTLGSYQVQISAVNGYTGLKESTSFNVKIDSCTTTQTGSVTQTTTTATTPTNTTGTSTNTSSTSTANPDSGTSTGTTTSTNSSQDSKSFVVQVLLFENNSSDYRVLLSEDRLGGLNGDADPDLNFYVGDTISFEVNTPGHPFYLKTVRGTGNGDLISGVANNGIINGTISWTPSVEGTYYYQCSLHSGMVGTINITN
ncbi:MAG: hypothetical protein VXY18_01810 [Bacteroidota bacterium]|nr:hypothetical protein [Bacteroidota bacterium]